MQFKATTQIKHDATTYQEGEILNLSSAEAAPLLEAKAVTPVGTPFKTKTNPLFEAKP